eukprot:CAMPEP_0172154146 /NCGR_PEP_ID=MMETSP1050-20130122/1865_1 /TAXON_ID=233186 /ORGANISM="Cryptomonas curvata, Strain CCAP979/52" /LENGTH=1090 /DNA_ID=CAMNT_0012822815 /DNA_START=137 /DNA_END=3409 /DNA_ORIENTATION=+
MRLPQILARSRTGNLSEAREETDVLNLVQKNESSSFFDRKDISPSKDDPPAHPEDELQFFDEHGKKITRAQAKRADRFDDLDRQTEMVRSLIQNDKNYKDLVLIEKEEQRRRGGIRQFIKQQIADFLVPPAIRPQYEREREEMRQEQLAQLALKRKGSVFRADLQADTSRGPTNPKILETGPQNFAQRHSKAHTVILAHRSEKKNASAAQRFDMLDHYIGDRFQGTRHGFGTQVFENGDKYQGQWVDGYEEGFGKMTFESKDEYCGQWHFGRQHGLGVFKSSSGGAYRGYWLAGLREGYGETCDRFGRISFRGEWRGGKRHGCGVKVKPGIAFMGEWLEDKKHGAGIIRSDVAAIGIGRFFTKWERGRLVWRGPYDALLHGMDVTNAATWASRYAGAAGDDALTVVRLGIGYPGRPDQRARDDQHALGDDVHGLGDDSEIPEHVKRFRDTWVTSRSALQFQFRQIDSDSLAESCDNGRTEPEPTLLTPETPIPHNLSIAAGSDQASSTRPDQAAHVAKSSDPTRTAPTAMQHRVRVPARELRRLISLVHSADKAVEELVLPILNDAVHDADCTPGEEVFVIGPVWGENTKLLKIHFAIKIQRKWRSLSWRRAFKAARVLIDDGKDLEANAILMKQHALESEYEIEQHLNEQMLVEKVNNQSLNAKFAAFADRGECGAAIVELFKRSKKLFGLEMQTGNMEECCDRWLLYDDDTIGTVHVSKPLRPDLVSHTEQTLGDTSKLITPNNEDVDVTIGKYIADNGVVYYGQIGNQVPHGFGTARYPDGTLYAGQFTFGQRHGVGEYVRQLEDHDRHLECSYMGEWQENQRHGFAIEQKKAVGFVDELLSSHLVEYKEDKLVSCVTADEETTAEWVMQCKEVSTWARRAADEAQALSHEKKISKQSSLKLSKLIEFSLNQGFSCYYGSFDNEGRKVGPGMLEFDTGRRLAGDWSDGIFEGFGREDLADGSSYVGQFRGGKRHGLGRFEYAEENVVSTYSGEWNEELRHGKGIERRERKLGDVVELEWVAVVEYVGNAIVNLDGFNAGKMASFMDQVELAVRNGARLVPFDSCLTHQVMSRSCVTVLMTPSSASKS